MPAVQIVDCSAESAERVREAMGETAARHLHFDDGFTLVACESERIVGLLAVQHRAGEGFIDIIEVAEGYRRQGIATKMIESAARRVPRLRAWSSDDKTAAIAMWKRLGFTLEPATTESRGSIVHGVFVVRASAGG